MITAMLVALVFAEAAPEYTGTVAEAEAKLTEASAATDLKAKGNALIALNDYLGTVDPTATGLDTVKAAAGQAYADYIGQLTAAYTPSARLVTRSSQVKQITRYIKALPIPENANGYQTTLDTYRELKAKVDADLAKAEDDMEFYATKDEYNWTDILYNNYDGVSNYELAKGNYADTFVGKESGKDGENSYSTITVRRMRS